MFNHTFSRQQWLRPWPNLPHGHPRDSEGVETWRLSPLDDEGGLPAEESEVNYLLQLEEWLTGVLFQVRPDGRGDHRPDHLWRGRNGCGTGSLWQLCSWSPWQVEKIFSTALISLRLLVALSKRVTPIWLCLRLNIFRFYMMRKAPAIHPAMSEHYNVWASFESELLINNPMNWDKLSR